SRELDCLLAHLDTDHGARRADDVGEEPQAALWTTTNLDDTSTSRNADLLEESTRHGRQLARLLLEPSLLGFAVAEKVRVAFSHDSSGVGAAIPHRARRDERPDQLTDGSETETLHTTHSQRDADTTPVQAPAVRRRNRERQPTSAPALHDWESTPF